MQKHSYRNLIRKIALFYLVIRFNHLDFSFFFFLVSFFDGNEDSIQFFWNGVIYHA